MISPLNSDSRDELYVSALRCWVIVDFCAYNKQNKKILTMQKAAILDNALRNPKVAKRIIYALLPQRAGELHLPEILYPDNAEYGDTLSAKALTTSASVLKSMGLIEIERVDGDFYLSPTSIRMINTDALPVSWIQTIRLLQPLVQKTLSALQKSTLREDL